MKFINVKEDRKILLVVLLSFIITELIDDVLDSLLGVSIIHSITQLLLFIILFLVVARFYLGYYNKKVKTLIPKELREILDIIAIGEYKGIKTNLVDIRKKLNITKPTLKKRIDQLSYLNYITFEKNGNNKYISLTELGNNILK